VLLKTLAFAAMVVGCGEARPLKNKPTASANGSGTPPNDPPTTQPPAKEPTKSAVAAAPQQRKFRLDYGATLAQVPAGAKVRVWIPVPPSTDHQQVTELARKLPSEAKLGQEAKYGNQMLYFETKGPEPGKVEFQISWEVRRSEVLGLGASSTAKTISPEERKKFLAPDAKVPVGDAKPLALLGGAQLPSEPIALARVLYDKVDDHVEYSKVKGPGWGRGDTLWVCDSRFGNCTDFHSLFISLARSKGLPAKFEIGFPLPPVDGKTTSGEIKGYHCWAYFFIDGHGWVPVDISEADKLPKMKDYYFGNLTADRVTFTTGRDLVLEPKQDGEPLNFFVYPYIEVDGKPYEGDAKVQRQFLFQDL